MNGRIEWWKKQILGLYILHPKAHDNGYKVLQFNAVVATNVHARHLYERVGFKQLGTIPNGFRLKNGKYEDICPYYIEV